MTVPNHQALTAASAAWSPGDVEPDPAPRLQSYEDLRAQRDRLRMCLVDLLEGLAPGRPLAYPHAAVRAAIAELEAAKET